MSTSQSLSAFDIMVKCQSEAAWLLGFEVKQFGTVDNWALSEAKDWAMHGELMREAAVAEVMANVH